MKADSNTDIQVEITAADMFRVYHAHTNVHKFGAQ